MHGSFLDAARTIPHLDRDFVEWHKGVSHYGFWAVLVEDSSWLDLLKAARAYVKQFIHPGYRRSPHITIAACGLLSEKQFSSEFQRRQTAALRDANVSSFILRAGALDSFSSAPYMVIEDPARSLDRIRSILAVISKEDHPAGYRPHITLGLYQEAFDTVRVADHLRGFRPLPVGPLSVTELAFCAYETCKIQGPLTVLERVELAAPKPPDNRNL